MALLTHPAKVLRERIERYMRQPRGLASLNEDQVLQIMRCVRKVIEKDDLKAVYPFAKLYGDWMLHTDINSIFSLSIIQRINVDYCDEQPLELLVPKAIGLDKLRWELCDLFVSREIPDELLQTASYWFKFGSLLLEGISDVPAGFPEEPDRKARGVLEQVYQKARESYGVKSNGTPPVFDRIVIEGSIAADDNYMWRLEFVAPDGSRWAVRGRLLFSDPRPFRTDDIGLRYGVKSEEILGALELELANRSMVERVVAIEEPPSRQ